jgi:hypothetical protein
VVTVQLACVVVCEVSGHKSNVFLSAMYLHNLIVACLLSFR